MPGCKNGKIQVKESVSYRLLREMSLEDQATHRKWIEMDKSKYKKLLVRVIPFIAKTDTKMRNVVTAGEHLKLTVI